MNNAYGSALKPCPFCGGTELLQTDKMVNEVPDMEAGDNNEAMPPMIEAEEWFVVCGMCSAMGPLSPSACAAQAAWNRRADGEPGT